MTPNPEEERAGATACKSCGADLTAGQEWCVSCGSATPGRLNRRPGARVALTTVAITLAITGGAVAASFAALSNTPVSKGEVLYPLQASQGVVQPAAKPTTKRKIKRAVKKHKAKTVTAASKAATTKKATKAPSTSKTTTTTTPAPVAPKLITIPAGGGALYDPNARALFSDDDPHDPAAVYDDDKETSWAVTANGDGELLVGYVVDLKRARPVQRLELLTDTPGFRAEIYGANSDVLPPQISDSRWAELKFRDNVDGTTKEKGKIGDGKERISFNEDAQKYRYILLWFSAPAPTVAPNPPSRTVRLFDLKLYG